MTLAYPTGGQKSSYVDRHHWFVLAGLLDGRHGGWPEARDRKTATSKREDTHFQRGEAHNRVGREEEKGKQEQEQSEGEGKARKVEEEEEEGEEGGT